jgi:hypothetical protein
MNLFSTGIGATFIFVVFYSGCPPITPGLECTITAKLEYSSVLTSSFDNI